ncbi:MAG: SGNH/GDSL hydrolase family protein [Armatimonadota bacterium]|jgi:hypothetical protein
MTAWRVLFTMLTILVTTGTCAAESPSEIRWVNATSLRLEGQGWPGETRPFRRLPDRAEGKVPEKVWELSGNCAGLAVRFVSDSSEIHVRWTVSAPFTMNHMADTGISGLDLYVRRDGGWRWMAVGRPDGVENEKLLVSGLPREQRELMLYLPLYNGLTRLEIGVPAGCLIEPAPAWPEGTKPIVFYGTSIVQGGCASRPGMAYPAILGRRLDLPSVNLGFSGNGKTEPEMADLLAELDAAVFVIDPLPNMGAVPVEERITYLLDVLRRKRPGTPVILVESYGNRGEPARSGRRPEDTSINEEMRRAYQKAKPLWGGLLTLVEGRTLLGEDCEDTVDGVHPTDLGFHRLADALEPAIRKALGR